MFSVRTNNNRIREMQMLVNYVLIMKCGWKDNMSNLYVQELLENRKGWVFIL
jgi:hypothetical protein